MTCICSCNNESYIWTLRIASGLEDTTIVINDCSDNNSLNSLFSNTILISNVEWIMVMNNR